MPALTLPHEHSLDTCGPRSCRAQSISKGAAERAVDLANGTEVIGEMRNAGNHAVQLHLVVVARRAKGFEPGPRIARKSLPQRGPFLIVDDRALPARRPVRS